MSCCSALRSAYSAPPALHNTHVKPSESSRVNSSRAPGRRRSLRTEPINVPSRSKAQTLSVTRKRVTDFVQESSKPRRPGSPSVSVRFAGGRRARARREGHGKIADREHVAGVVEPLHFAVDPEVGQPRNDLLDHHAEHHPRVVRAEAAVGPEAEA